MRAAPVDDADLAARFATSTAACRLDCPGSNRSESRAVSWRTPLALPSLRRSSVVFTDTLLQRLTADEVEAICAHELAHLEHFDATRLRRHRLVTTALILGCAATAPLARWYGSGSLLSSLMPYIWIAAVIIALALRGRTRQANETASDLRAVALTGNPEALVSALTRCMPSHACRGDGMRSSNSDPRIRASPGGFRPSARRRHRCPWRSAPSRGSPLAAAHNRLRRPSPGVERARRVLSLGWLRRPDGVAGRRHARGRGDAGRDRQDATPLGDSLSPDDVGRIQAVLDFVDVQLAKPVLPRIDQTGAARAAAGVVALAGLLAVQWAAVLTALVAAVRPSPRLLAATAAAA